MCSKDSRTWVLRDSPRRPTSWETTSRPNSPSGARWSRTPTSSRIESVLISPRAVGAPLVGARHIGRAATRAAPTQDAHKNPFSRRAFASELCPSHAQESPPLKEGRRSADRRIHPLAAPADAAAASSETARLSALHRGACHANQGRGSAQAVFPATCAAAGVSRRALSQSSEAPRRPVIVPDLATCPR